MKIREKSAGQRRKHGFGVLGAGVLGAALVYLLIVPGSNEPARAADEPATKGTMPGFRRLNEGQYYRSIEQIFGSGINVPGRFAPPLREEGLMAIGDNHVTVTPSGIEQYELRAREISAQVLDENRRGNVMPCAPASPQAFDAGCAAQFVGKYGRLLYRRPLTSAETSSVLDLVKRGTAQSGSFYKGLELGLSRLLISPKFLFRIEETAANPDDPSDLRLDDYARATRISFLLWDAPPDEELLDAAGRGDLRNRKKLARQVDRLIASPKFEQGVRSFFSDMFGYENFAGLAKDQAIYPKFNGSLAADAKEQTLRTIVDLLITNKGDYRDLFTTKKTFINRNLGALYKVPVPEAGMDGWAPITFAQDDPRAGILTLAGFLMLDPTHEGRSSPTIRGKTIRELLLCQPVPQPPPNVNFAAVQDVHNPLYRTARQRLSIHQENPACAGCHSLTDPIGLSMENYDAVGEYRTHENGAVIDASGTFNGKPYTGLIEFSRLLHDSEEAPSCVVQRAYEYGVGRAATEDDEQWLQYAVEGFAHDKYRFPALMRMIAMSEALETILGSQPLNPADVVAAR